MDRAYKIARNRKYDACQTTLTIMICKFSDKKTESRMSVMLKNFINQ